MEKHKLLYIITFICILFTLKMCDNVKNSKINLLLEEKDNLDLLSELYDTKHENYKLKKCNDSINKLYQKAIYVKPIIKKPYIKKPIQDSIVTLIEIKDTL